MNNYKTLKITQTHTNQHDSSLDEGIMPDNMSLMPRIHMVKEN